MRLILLASLACAMAAARPLDADYDTEVVGSSLNVVRVAAPDGPPQDQQWAATGDSSGDKHRHSQHGDRDEVGYLRSKDTRGDHGYQAFDSFHKKGGDKYGFETHSAYGKVKGAEGGGGGHHDEKPEGTEHHEEYGGEWSEGYSKGDDGKGNKYSESYSTSSDDDDGGDGGHY